MAVLRLPQVDADPLRDVMRELRDVDLSRLSALRDELGERERAGVTDLRREFERLDLGGAWGDLREGLGRLDLEMPQVRRLFGRPARPGISLGPALALGVVVLVGGAVVGGLLAWLLHPEAGPGRRKAVRRRLHRLQRRIQHAR